MSPDTAVIRALIEGAPEAQWPDPLPLVPDGETQKAYPLDVLPTVIGEAVGCWAKGRSGSKKVRRRSMRRVCATPIWAGKELLKVARMRY